MIIYEIFNIRFIKNNQIVYLSLKSNNVKKLVRLLNLYKNRIGYRFISSSCYHSKEDNWI